MTKKEIFCNQSAVWGVSVLWQHGNILELSINPSKTSGREFVFHETTGFRLAALLKVDCFTKVFSRVFRKVKRSYALKRSSRLQMFLKIGALKNFVALARKQLH